jgi:hypothetical protein
MPSPIAFIIPALNEEAALPPMLDGLRAALDAAACADADILVGTVRAGWKILWTIAKYGLFSKH